VSFRALRLFAAFAGLAGLALFGSSCTNVTRFGVGPVAAFPDDQGASWGDELILRRGIGTSDFSSIAAAEYEARALVTERTQALSLGAGPTYMPWLGPVLVSMSGTPAVGIERVHHKVLGNVGLHGGLGLSFPLAESLNESRHVPLVQMGPWNDGYVSQARDRTLLGFELTGSVDVRGTRAPLLAAGLLVQLTFTEERREVPVPAIAPGLLAFPPAPRD